MKTNKFKEYFEELTELIQKKHELKHSLTKKLKELMASKGYKPENVRALYPNNSDNILRIKLGNTKLDYDFVKGKIIIDETPFSRELLEEIINTIEE